MVTPGMLYTDVPALTTCACTDHTASNNTDHTASTYTDLTALIATKNVTLSKAFQISCFRQLKSCFFCVSWKSFAVERDDLGAGLLLRILNGFGVWVILTNIWEGGGSSTVKSPPRPTGWYNMDLTATCKHITWHICEKNSWAAMFSFRCSLFRIKPHSWNNS